MNRRNANCVIGLIGGSLAGVLWALPALAQAVESANQTRSIRVPGTTVSFEIVLVPAGTVEIDNEHHEVPAMWVLPHEVTWDLYDIFLYQLERPESERESIGKGADAVTRPSKPYVPPDRGLGHEGYPAMGMTIHAARSFSEWLGGLTGVDCRLPTKAEWIHLSSGEGGQAWHKENAEFTTHPVKRLEANEYGLYDTLGNVAEWVETGERRPIAMGGSYKQPEDECTPTSQMQQASNWNASDPQIPKSRWWLADCSWVGFRFVVTATEEGANDESD